jgi:adenine-specific DNA-methyltransferase
VARVSRLTELIGRVERIDPSLAGELAASIKVLSDRREFGLNFERHIPESVELPARRIRRSDKVRFLAPRDNPDELVDKRLWWVARIKTIDDVRMAELLEIGPGDEPLSTSRRIDDLVAVAEFRDPIFPGLRPTGQVLNGGDKPSHVVINGENYHALEALAFAYEGKVDAIYIDPPYNTRDKDWKYNNDYVDADDVYKHSKWLAFMERRLKLAKRLLNGAESVLIVTIDEKEVHRLGLLLGQVFPQTPLQMISTVINPKGASLGRDFARVDEYTFVLYFGNVGVKAEVRDMLDEKKNERADTSVKWSSLIRGGAQGIRRDSPGAYYPVFIDPATKTIHSFGEALPWEQDRDDVSVPEGTIAVWPPTHPSGVEGRWGIGPDKARELYALGALRLGKVDVEQGKFPLSYLTSGIMQKVQTGEIVTEGRAENGALIVRYPTDTKVTQPKTVWKMPGHNAGEYGSKLITAFLPGRKFPFPKALYGVEDILRFFVKDKPDALVLDFFAGSGTTAHAVMRLNKQDGGHRRCVLVTNNEVSVGEAARLRRAGHRPSDAEWEALGICSYITNPRLTAAITGMTPEGAPVSGDYKFVDPFPMADGLDENIQFFNLTYEDANEVRYDFAFGAIAHLLWLRAGSRGRCIDRVTDDFDIAEAYGVLFNIDAASAFLSAVSAAKLRCAFIITDSESQYQVIANELPEWIEPVRLYEAYLRSATMTPEAD